MYGVPSRGSLEQRAQSTAATNETSGPPSRKYPRSPMVGVGIFVFRPGPEVRDS